MVQQQLSVGGERALKVILRQTLELQPSFKGWSEHERTVARDRAPRGCATHVVAVWRCLSSYTRLPTCTYRGVPEKNSTGNRKAGKGRRETEGVGDI